MHGLRTIERFANMLPRPDLRIGQVSTYSSSTFMRLVLVCDGLLPNQAGVLLPSSTGLGTTGSALLLLAFAALFIAARFARPTIEPRSAPSARNRLQPDHQVPRRPSVENVIRRHVHFMPIPYIVLYFCYSRFSLALTCLPAWDSLV